MATSSQVMSVPTGQTGRQETLSEWAGPYVTSMLGKAEALSNTPYQTYQGPLTAGASPLQMQAFQGIGSLAPSQGLGAAQGVATDVAQGAAGLGYTPGQFQSQFAAPGAFQGAQFTPGFNYSPTAATQFGNQFQAPGAYQSRDFTSGFDYQAPTGTTNFANQFKAPGDYQAGSFQGGIFGLPQAQQYMNPYLQSALNPMMDEARRQAQITRMNDASRLAQAGAFGGSRQAIMESELNRNLMTKQNEMLAQGYNTAFDKAANLFGQDAARALQAQQMGEQSRQFGAGQSMQAAQLAAQFGLSAQQAQEAARQFNAQQALSAAQTRSQSALEAQRLGEQSRQFGAGQGMTAAQLQAQYGLSAQQAQEAARQFNAGQVLTASQLQSQFGLDAQKAAEMSRQFGAQQAMQSAQLGAQYGTEAQRQAEQSRQFGAQYGLQGLAQRLDAARLMGTLGQTAGAEQRANLAQMLGAGEMQRGIEQQGIAADLAEFQAQRDFPYKQLQFQQSMLQGMPIQSVAAQYQQPSSLANLMNTTGGLMDLYDRLFPQSTTSTRGGR